MNRINFRGCHPENFTQGRHEQIKYIVIHYTANNGDTAAGNANYFSSNIPIASAHYFVDETPEIWQTVQDGDTAWHCGTKGEYRHPLCRNANSIGVEMCSRKDELGRYYTKAETVANTAELVQKLMEKYGILPENVLRHYDVTGKNCPAPFVEDEGLWRDFLGRLAPEPVPRNTVRFNLFGEKTVDIGGENADGVILANARELLEAMGFTVGWVDEWKTVAVLRKIYTLTCEEHSILEKIVEAEAGGEDEMGKILVANVIINRVKANGFPDTIKEVVFAPMQFEPTRNGAFEKAVPSQATKIAVEKVLCGVDYSRGALFFRGIKGATPECWHESALVKLFDHGGHRFYA